MVAVAAGFALSPPTRPMARFRAVEVVIEGGETLIFTEGG